MTARTVPPIPTFAYQEQPTSAKLNEFGTFLSFWSNRPMFRMYQSVSQNIPNSAWTQITMDTATGTAAWDTDSGRSATSPWSYVIPAGLTGRWCFRWKVSCAANSSGDRYSALWQNGVVVQGGEFHEVALAVPTDMATGSLTVLCNAGDTMAVYGWQNSGGTLATDTQYTGTPSFFEGSFESFANP